MIEQTLQRYSLALTNSAAGGGMGLINQQNKVLAVLLGLLMALGIFSVHAATPMPAESQFNVSLNGKWRFKLEQQNGKSKRPASYGQKYPIELPATFEAFYRDQLRREGPMAQPEVPGNWEMAGYSPATYYQPDNASGFYRKKFVVPEAWQRTPGESEFRWGAECR